MTILGEPGLLGLLLEVLELAFVGLYLFLHFSDFIFGFVFVGDWSDEATDAFEFDAELFVFSFEVLELLLGVLDDLHGGGVLLFELV